MEIDKKFSLLIVDDRSSNILLLAQILKPDYDIYAAKNGKDAIRIAAENSLALQPIDRTDALLQFLRKVYRAIKAQFFHHSKLPRGTGG